MNSNSSDPPAAGAAEDSPDLVARARAGDGESFDLLCEARQDRLMRQAFVLCRDEGQAQDLTQETLVQAWKSFHRFNGQCQLGTWLCSILLHRYRSALRRARWRAWVTSLSGAEEARAAEEAGTPDPAPDEAVQLSERFLAGCLAGQARATPAPAGPRNCARGQVGCSARITNSRNSRARRAKASISAGSSGRGKPGANMFSQQSGIGRPVKATGCNSR